MNTRFVTAAAAAILFAAPALASWRGIEGNGHKITEQRNVPPFERIQLHGAIDANVKVGPAQSVALTIDANLMRHVRTRVDDGTLVIDTDESLSWDGEAHAEITVPRLRGLSTGGSGDARIEGGSGDDLELSSSGSGDIRWRGEAKALTVRTSGSADVALAGRAQSLEASTSGSGDVEGDDFTVHDATVRTSGSGSVTIRMDGGTLRARTSGSGDVTYYGDARLEEARTSGSGEIRRR